MGAIIDQKGTPTDPSSGSDVLQEHETHGDCSPEFAERVLALAREKPAWSGDDPDEYPHKD